MDAANIDEGQVASVQEAALGSPTFTGTGINDLAVSGNYNGTADRTYRVKIAADGASFDWSNDNGSTWQATGVAITGAAQLLEYGVHITLPTGSGYNQNDYWTFPAATWGVTLSGLTATSHVYAAGARIGTTLPLRSVAAAVYSLTTAAAGVSESPPSRVYLEDVAGFAAGQIVYVSDLDGTVGERAEVDAVGANYIDLTLGLAYDYPAGALVNVESVGSVAFHLRPKALTSTTEELKRVRLNARF